MEGLVWGEGKGRERLPGNDTGDQSIFYSLYLSITFWFCCSMFLENVAFSSQDKNRQSAKEKRRYISMASLRQPEVIRGRNVAIDYGALDAVIRSFQRAIYLLTLKR